MRFIKKELMTEAVEQRVNNKCLSIIIRCKKLVIIVIDYYQLYSSSSSSSSSLQPGVGFGLLYQLIPLLSISNQFLPVLHLEHFHIFEDSIDPSVLGSSCWSFPKWFPVG